MKFGKVLNPSNIDFTLPKTDVATERLLSGFNKVEKPSVYIGCAKWNKADLKGFYPKGTKDELIYYASQFNSIELNATFYRQFPKEQFTKWKDKTPDGFKFFPKLTQTISHFKRLQNVTDDVNYYLDCALALEDKLGTIFLQLHENFSPNNFKYLQHFVNTWPKEVPLSVEVRNSQWFSDAIISNELFDLLAHNSVSNTIVDTAGRRDMMHMRLTNNEAFIRYVGANHPSDYTRLDDWVITLKKWVDLGLQNIHFFIHQNHEEASPMLAEYLIKKINLTLGTSLLIPNQQAQQTLF